MTSEERKIFYRYIKDNNLYNELKKLNKWCSTRWRFETYLQNTTILSALRQLKLQEEVTNDTWFYLKYFRPWAEKYRNISIFNDLIARLDTKYVYNFYYDNANYFYNTSLNMPSCTRSYIDF